MTCMVDGKFRDSNGKRWNGRFEAVCPHGVVVVWDVRWGPGCCERS